MDDVFEYNEKIEDISSYIKRVTFIRNEMLEEGRSETLFFRGQSNIKWDIRPSIFRSSLISVESEIIQKAIARVPHEFENYLTAFEKLTKLQHYGLPTRLLDVTMNPLVALYFACCSSNVADTDGCVFYGYNYGEFPTADRVKILSLVAQTEFKGDITLGSLKDISNWKQDAKPFIQLLQNNLLVFPNYSNGRIMAQSGAFLLPGAITINIEENNLWNSKIQKSTYNLNSSFSDDIIIISKDSKSQILDELNYLNINEGTLFPELEHQMSYIKHAGTRLVNNIIPEFIRYESQMSFPDKKENSVAQSNHADNTIKKIVQKYIKENIIEKEIISIINRYAQYPDWNHRENIISSLFTEIKRNLSKHKKQNVKQIADRIVNELRTKIKQQ